MSNPGGLGRIPKVDTRDFPVALAGMAEAAPVLAGAPAYRYWSTPSLPLDQGDTPQCVGYTARGLLYAGPIGNRGGPDAPTIYANAQRLDEIPGEAYDGTTARGAMRYLQSLGYVSAYVWPRSIDEALAWVLTRGPLMAGVDWYASFDRPGKGAVLSASSAGGIRGGHEFLISGANRATRRFRMVNSWGAGWGAGGRAWVPFDVLDMLLHTGGDLCAASEVRLAAGEVLA